MNSGDACICIINTNQDERNQQKQQKKSPTGFPPEGKPSVVILQDEWALRLRRDIQCISDMLCTLASLPNALAWIEIDVQDLLQKRGVRLKKNICCIAFIPIVLICSIKASTSKASVMHTGSSVE